MKFCKICGHELEDSYKFCICCGKPVFSQDKNKAVPRRIMYRYKCAYCKNVYNGKIMSTCPKCNNDYNLDLNKMGLVEIYRMGNYVGSMAPEGIYLNKEPYGHIGNTESIVLALPEGKYTLHCTISMIRKCEDIEIDVKAGEIQYYKTSVNVGFLTNTIQLKKCEASEMPELSNLY